MARYIQEEVANVAEQPTEGEEITVIVGAGDEALAAVQERARELGASTVAELPFESLQVTIPENRLGELCDAPGVESVETDDGMEVLSGN